MRNRGDRRTTRFRQWLPAAARPAARESAPPATSERGGDQRAGERAGFQPAAHAHQYAVLDAHASRRCTAGGRQRGIAGALEFSRPRHWLFGRAYRAYFRYLLPLVGQLFSRSGERAYAYLPASVMEFPDGEALAERMRAAGLRDVSFKPLTFGIATLYVGTK